MDDILGKKRNINPVLVLAADTIDTLVQEEPIAVVIEEIVEEVPEQPATSNVKETNQKFKERTSRRRTKVDYLKKIREDRQEYYRKRLAQEDKRLELLAKHLNAGKTTSLEEL